MVMKHQSHSRDVRRKLRKTVKPIGTLIQSNATKGGHGVSLSCLSSRTTIKKAQNTLTSQKCSSPRASRRHQGFLGVGCSVAGCGSGTSAVVTSVSVAQAMVRGDPATTEPADTVADRYRANQGNSRARGQAASTADAGPQRYRCYRDPPTYRGHNPTADPSSLTVFRQR